MKQKNITSELPNIYCQIYELVRLIPKGRVSSYGAIAQTLGVKSGARLVGYAMSQSHHIKPPVPAHRVVNRNGLLTGKFHFESINKMQQLLEKEGVEVIDDKVQNFNKIFWNPLTAFD